MADNSNASKLERSQLGSAGIAVLTPAPTSGVESANRGTTPNGENLPVKQPDLSHDIPPSKNSSSSDGVKATSDGNANGGTSWFKKACKTVEIPLGDEKLADGKDLLARRSLSHSIGPDKIPTLFASNKLLWDGTPQILSYYFIDGNESQRNKVAKVIDEWTWYANVEFREASSAEDSNIRIRFNPDDGSWSYVGTQSDRISKQDATINLAWLDASSDLTSNERAVILHEFGHVLGLIHEHQSPAHRGYAVKNIGAALDLYSKPQGWSDQQIYDQVINVYKVNDVSNFSRVDIQSIMHYPQPKEITGLDYDIPYNLTLTDLEKAYMILRYPRPSIHPKAAEQGWTFNKALQVMGTPPDVTNKVLQFLESDHGQISGQILPLSVRETLEKWCRATLEGQNTSPAQTIDPAHVTDNATQLTVEPTGVIGVDGQPQQITSQQVKTEEPFIHILDEKLKTSYGPSDGQDFALEHSTRFLDKQSYANKLDGYFSRFNKPVVVNEAEFSLTDALYPVAPIVGGANGQTLSANYSKALNSLIPTFDTKDVRKQREKMRQWLLRETKSGNAAYTEDTRLTIPGIDFKTAQELSEQMGMPIIAGPSLKDTVADQDAAKQMALQAIRGVQKSNRVDPRGMTRMEYSGALMQAYLSDRKTWELQRDNMIKEASQLASTDPQAMERLTRRLVHTSAIEEAKLSSKYADAVVRGYSHTVRGFKGHLDIKSVAELPQDAKGSMHESALSSLYTASAVHPVVAMQPADWFEALDTGSTREDMSQDPELIVAAIKAKEQLIDNLENQIANLRTFNEGELEAAKRALQDAAAQCETAMVNLSQRYTAATISAVKIAIDVDAPATAPGHLTEAASKGVNYITKLDNNDEMKKDFMALFGGDSIGLTEIGKQMDDVAMANAEVNATSRLVTEHMSAYSTAIAGDR